MRWLVLPTMTVAAELAGLTERGAGLVLVLVAAEVLRRRLGGRMGAGHGHEAAGALAGLALGGLSMTMSLLLGGAPQRVNAALALGPRAAIEPVPWMEPGRFAALRPAASSTHRPTMDASYGRTTAPAPPTL